MKPEDVKIGMKVYSKIYNSIVEVVWIPFGKIKVNYIKARYRNVVINLGFDDIEPYTEKPEFTWDKSVPTIGEPIFSKYDNNWYIEVDRSKPVIFDKKILIKIANNDSKESLTETLMCAIVPASRYPFSLDCGCSNCKILIPLTYTPKEREVTMKEVEEKFGCKIKIKAEG